MDTKDTDILNDASDLVLAMELSGNIIYANKAISHFYGLKEAQLVEKNYRDLIPEEREKEFERVRNSILFGETVQPFESLLAGKDKKPVNFSFSFSPVKDREGQLKGISVIARPIPDIRKAENKAQALLETAPDAMIIVNSFGQIVLANAQTEKMFDYKREELYGQPIEILIPGRFKERHSRHRKNYGINPKTRSMGAGLELHGKRKNGEEFPVEISLSPLQTDEGTFVSAAVRDISDRKKAEEKFRNLLESAPDAMVIVDRDGIIQLVNAQTEKLFGYKKVEITGKPVELLIPQRFSGHKKHRAAYFENPKLRPMGEGFELFGKKKDNSEFPVEISLSPLETEEGLLVSAAIRDISEKKKLEKKLIEVNSELERKVKLRTAELERQNKELEQFAFIASHDLQEPLRTISNFVELMQKKYHHTFDEKATQYFDFIRSASHRMTHLILGLLEYSRIGRSSAIQNVNSAEIVQNVMADLQAVIKMNNAEFRVDSLPEIKGYRIELKMLFQNLINNAIKFRKPDVNPKIKISSSQINGYYKFSVEDNGIGIEPQYFEKIFIIYQRLHSSAYEGSGIGLSHCKKIVELHGGRLWLESEPGKGSTFIFTIPA
jgi:PAS domain S-box-containing protein